jgi:hypothetical protein
MLYDVFDQHARATGFRRFHPEEIDAWRRQREAEGKTMSATARKAAAKNALPDHEGRLVKPEATFFYASVKASTLDCHPDRVRFVRSNGGWS